MRITYMCECGTIVETPERFARSRFRCPGCRKTMVAAEPGMEATRLEMPFIEDAIEEGERSRISDRYMADLHHRKKGLLATLPRLIGFVALMTLVALLCVWILLKPKAHRVERTAIRKGLYVTMPVEEQPTAQVVPTIPEGDVTTSEKKVSMVPEAPQPGGQGAQLEPPLHPLSPTKQENMNALPLSPSPEGLKEDVPLVYPEPSKPVTVEESPDTVPVVEQKEIDTTRGESAGTGPDHGMAMHTKPSPAVSPTKGKFILNVASFKEKEKADQYKDELRRQGIEAFYWVVHIPQQGTWYRVSVGNFSTREQAELAARKLEQTLKIKPIVAKAP